MTTYVKLLELMNAGNYEGARAALRANIREESAKKSGNANKQKILEAVMKENAKNPNKLLCKANAQKDGSFAILNSWRIFFADTPCGFDVETERPFDASAILAGSTTYSGNMEPFCDRISFDRAQVDLFIKFNNIKRSTRQPAPFFVKSENDKIYAFNPIGILDFIDYSGSEVALANGPKAPIVAENKSAVLLPICRAGVETCEEYDEWIKKTFSEV